MNDSALSVGVDVPLEDIGIRALDQPNGREAREAFSVTNSLPGARSTAATMAHVAQTVTRLGYRRSQIGQDCGLPNYKPRATVAISSSAHPTATSQKPIPGVMTGMDVRLARIPTTPRIKATIHVICFGALTFNFICSLRSDVSVNLWSTTRLAAAHQSSTATNECACARAPTSGQRLPGGRSALAK